MKLLLLGATGNIGQQVVKHLAERGVHPLAGVRDAERAARRLANQAELIPFDFQLTSTFAPALRGVDRLFFIAPHTDPAPSVQGMLQAAREAGVQYVVFSSGRTTGDVPGKPLNQVERLVEASGLPWTILRPGWFMQNFASWLGEWIPSEGKIYLPAGDSLTAFVDVRDIGETVATLLCGHGHNGEIYELTGSEAIDHYGVARLIGAAAGKSITYMPLQPVDFVNLMVEKGWPRPKAEYTAQLYEWVRRGKEARPSPDMAHLLGRSPRRFADFAGDYRHSWS